MKKLFVILIVILVLILGVVVISATILGLQKKVGTNADINTNFEILEKATENSGCPISEQEVERMRIKMNELNSTVSEKSKYSGNGISIDFGKYGFTEIDSGNIYFGEWKIFGDVCVNRFDQKYILGFVDAMPKEDVVSKVKNLEYELKEVVEGLKLKEIVRINNFDVVVWESWAPYPTRSLFFEIPGKIKNYYIEVSGFEKNEKDYINIMEILKTATIK